MDDMLVKSKKGADHMYLSSLLKAVIAALIKKNEGIQNLFIKSLVCAKLNYLPIENFALAFITTCK